MEKRSFAQWLECAWPFLFGLAAGLAAWHSDMTFSSSRLDGQLTATISISSILTGFLGTAQAIMLTVTTRRMEWVTANKDVWSQVLSFFRVALLANLVLCVWSLTLSAIGIDGWPARATPLLFPLWVAAIVVALVSFYKALTLLFNLLRR